jgi:radical SAM-linked protein
MFRQRLRVFFAKEGRLRFISHHDLMRLWERALRRTGLPLKLSEGFNPRPQISFPAALALGVESRSEVFETELTEWVSPRRAREILEKELPQGIGVTSVESVEHGDKAEVTGAEYAVRAERLPDDFERRLEDFLSKGEVLVERTRKAGGRAINVRRFVRYARVEDGVFTLGLTVTPAGTARPDEVLDAVVGDPAGSLGRLLVTRTRLDLSPPQSTGEL